MTRLAPIELSQMDVAQRSAYDAALLGRRQYVPAPLKAWLYSPEVALHAQRFGETIRFDLHLAPATTAIAALTTATWWRAGFVQGVQEAKLRTQGVADFVIEAIKAEQVPNLSNPAHAAAYATTRHLLTERAFGDAAYSLALAGLGEQGLVELVAAIGYYTLVSLTAVTFDIPRTDG